MIITNWRITATALSILSVALLIATTGSMDNNPLIVSITTSKSMYYPWEPVDIVLVPENSGDAGNSTLPDVTQVWICEPSGAYTRVNATYNGTCYLAFYDPANIVGDCVAYANGPGIGPYVIFTIDPPAPWPANESWVTYLNSSWQPLLYPTNDVNQPNIDISSGGNSTPGSKPNFGVNNSTYFYYNKSAQTIFFRILLSTTPISGSGYDKNVWSVFMDINGDGFTDWGCIVSAKQTPDQIMVGYNPRGSTLQQISTFVYTQNADPSLGFTRVTADGLDRSNNTMYFLDWQAPLSAFRSAATDSPGNITENTSLRLFFGTSNNINNINKDMAGYAQDISFANDGYSNSGGLFGMIYDTRDPSPPSNNGTWYYGDTVTASGWGWPVNNSQVQNLTVRVVAPNGVIVNNTTFNYNRTTMGNFTGVPICQIPSSGPYPPGYYMIQVKHPTANATIYTTYDNFTLVDNVPPVVRNLTLTPNTAAPLTSVLITANVTDNYMVALVNATLNGFTYPMTYNATSRLYEVTVTAPLPEGRYIVNVTALDTSGNRGNGTAYLYVVTPVNVTKHIAWNPTLQQYSVYLSASNPSAVNSSFVYDFIPAGFTASAFYMNGSAYAPDYHGAATIIGPATIGWRLDRTKNNTMAYVIQGNTPVYTSTGAYVVGIDPSAEAQA